MKNILMTLLFINITFSQTNAALATYELKRELNGFSFTAKGITTTDNENKISIFKLNQYDNLLKNGKKIFDEELNDTVVVVGSTSICTDPKEYYFNYKEKSLTQLLYNVNCKSKVVIEEKFEYPIWEIQDEFKVISGYKTQKATSFINDRTWTVYFTTEINENIAPWKLIGLPGVIIEATEGNSIYSFKLTKIEYPEINIKILKPSFSEISSFEDFVKISVKEKRDEMIFTLSQLEGVTDVDPDTFPLYETIDFIERRSAKE